MGMVLYDVNLTSSDGSSSPITKKNQISSVTVDELMPGANHTVTASAVGITGLRSAPTDEQSITTGGEQ